jgi:hypothetical protein
MRIRLIRFTTPFESNHFAKRPARLLSFSHIRGDYANGFQLARQATYAAALDAMLTLPKGPSEIVKPPINGSSCFGFSNEAVFRHRSMAMACGRRSHTLSMCSEFSPEFP